MTTLPEELSLEQAVEFLLNIKWADEEKARWVHITRYTNHHDWIPDGKWVAMIAVGSMNPWYLGADGMWRYKTYAAFETSQAAYAAVKRSLSIMASHRAQR